MRDDADIVDALVLEKLKVLAEKRYALGRERFGTTNLKTDPRDFVEETLEELIDCAWYMAAKLVQLKVYETPQRGEQLELFEGDLDGSKDRNEASSERAGKADKQEAGLPSGPDWL